MQTAVEAMKMGACDYITKLFNLDDLVLKVQKALEKRNLRLQDEHHLRELEERVGKQTEQLQQQFVELVETLAREHKLLYKLAERQPKCVKSLFSKLPKEL